MNQNLKTYFPVSLNSCETLFLCYKSHQRQSLYPVFGKDGQMTCSLFLHTLKLKNKTTSKVKLQNYYTSLVHGYSRSFLLNIYIICISVLTNYRRNIVSGHEMINSCVGLSQAMGKVSILSSTFNLLQRFSESSCAC